MKDTLKEYISPSLWSDVYYEIIDFYYWEPQHIGKTKLNNSKFKNVDSVINHISNLEVSLNHILNIYFSLLPSDTLTTIFQSISEKLESDDYQLTSINTDWLLKNETQPDFVFMGKKNICYIEMKTKSKSSQQQYEKYLKLHSKLELVTKKKFTFNLIFLSKCPITELFEEGYTDLQLLKRQVSSKCSEEILKISESAMIFHITYRKLLSILVKTNMQLQNPILTRMNNSIKAELKYRELV